MSDIEALQFLLQAKEEIAKGRPQASNNLDPFRELSLGALERVSPYEQSGEVSLPELIADLQITALPLSDSLHTSFHFHRRLESSARKFNQSRVKVLFITIH